MLELELESSISQNTRNFFREDFFYLWSVSLKSSQVATYFTTTIIKKKKLRAHCTLFFLTCKLKNYHSKYFFERILQEFRNNFSKENF